MVYVYPNTLSIDPVDPYTTDSVHVSAWIGNDNFDGWCPDLFGFTRTNIHLLRRNLDRGESRLQATHVATYDCYTKCCLDPNTEAEVPGHPGRRGWQIGFDVARPIPTPGKYEFFAVDNGDYTKTTYAPDRVAALTFEVTRDPTQTIEPIITPGESTTCADGDYMCQYKDYLPYIAIGGILLLVLMGSKRRK